MTHVLAYERKQAGSLLWLDAHNGATIPHFRVMPLANCRGAFLITQAAFVSGGLLHQIHYCKSA